MHIFIPLVLLVAVGLLLRFVSQSAKRLEFKKYSPLWISFIWGVSIGGTLFFRQYYDAPLAVYILLSTGIASITYLLVANADLPASLVFSISNTAALLAFMFYVGMLGEIDRGVITSGDVQLAADEVCQCGSDQVCLEEALPQMKKRARESQILTGNAAIIATNATARAYQCMAENPVKFEAENIATFLDDWEDEGQQEKIRGQKRARYDAEIIQQEQNTAAALRVVLQKEARQQETKVVQSESKAAFQSVTVSALNNHMGDILRLTKSNGKVLKGWLIADEGSKIIIKQKLSGGYVHMPIAKASISQLEVKSDNGVF